MSFHIGNFANLAGYPPMNPKYYVYLLDHNPKLLVWINISKKITRKASSSGARFWETSIKGSLEGFKYISS
jgi:hypothetical protein